MRILAVITGIVLMLTGVWGFAYRGTVFSGIAFVLGCVMVFAGALSILIYFFAPGKKEGVGWFLAEGAVTLALGGIVLANQLSLDSMVTPFFGMWVLFSGALRLAAALHLFKEKTNPAVVWIVTLFLGVVSMAAGVYAFFNQIMAGIPIIILTGIYFLMQGVNVLTYGVFIPQKKKIKKYGGTKRK